MQGGGSVLQSNEPFKYQIVREALHVLDLFGLLEMGAPQDEFDGEALMISRMISGKSSASEIANAFAQVLNMAFDLSDTPDTYIPIAKDIHSQLCNID